MRPGNTTGLPSAYDASNIATMYPVNTNSVVKPYIVGPDTFNANVFVAYNISYLSSEVGISYHWKVIGTNGTNYTFDLPFSDFGLYDLNLPKGNYQLQCTISGGKYSTPATTTKDIIVL